MVENQSVLQQVLEAFKHRPHPGADVVCLVRPEVPGHEGNRVRQALAHKTWEELSEEYLLQHFARGSLRAIPAFLTPQGFLYFLPAFLRLVLENFDRWFGLGEALCFYIEESCVDNGKFSKGAISPSEAEALVAALQLFATRFGCPDSVNPALTALYRLQRFVEDVKS